MISIFDYLDYRKYLHDFYLDKKKQMPCFSYRLIGQAVGMDSSFLIRVLQGSLHISAKKISGFIKVCKLPAQEGRYFEALVNFNKAKTEAQRKSYLETIFKISRVTSQRIEPFQYEFFQKWYHSAIWSLIQIQPRKPDHRILANLCEPAISSSQARESVELLERLGLIRCNETGCLEVTARHISTGEKWESQAIAGYQLEMIRRGEGALQNMRRADRDISTLTFTIREDALVQVRELAAEFRRTLTAFAEEEPDPDRSYQMNIQLFPITKKAKGAHA